jgi:hyperosmotically inducible protein
MLPYLDVFDNLTYSVNGRSVILSGQVTNPTLRSDAANAVKQIEGVETVDNQIEVLPASIFDDRIRKQLFQAIYGYPTLQRYSLGINKPIRIIIRNGNVQLEGIVDRPLDKVIAGIRARQVSGVFSVENNLKLAK